MNRGRPLEGIKVLDFSALGPGPFGTRLLADYGADVISIEAPVADPHDSGRMYGRGKRSMILDLKADGAKELIMDLMSKTDVIVESMRPGKMEALGLGPDTILERYPAVIYARLTAFGQSGTLANAAGHDINASAIAGPLAMTGLDQPIPASGLLGDFAGGSLLLVVGVLLALLDRNETGRGQVVDASMSDGCALLSGGILPLLNKGALGARGSNLTDGSRPFYATYRCKDNKWVALGAIEPKFFSAFLEAAGLLNDINPADQYDENKAESIKQCIGSTLLQKTRAEWVEIFADVDACFSPVVEPDELLDFPHNRDRQVFYTDGQGVQASVAPRLSAVQWQHNKEAPARGVNTRDVLGEFGLDAARIDRAIEEQVAFEC